MHPIANAACRLPELIYRYKQLGYAGVQQSGRVSSWYTCEVSDQAEPSAPQATLMPRPRLLLFLFASKRDTALEPKNIIGNDS